MSVLMVISIVLLVLVNRIPPMLGAIYRWRGGRIGNLRAESRSEAAGGASAIKAACAIVNRLRATGFLAVGGDPPSP
jgi:type IV secretion system protein TrbL